MSGLLADAELFARIAENWDRHLRFKHPGAIRYFKMDEAMTLSGELEHWQAADMLARQMRLTAEYGAASVQPLG